MSVPNEEYSYLAMACAKKDWVVARLLLAAEIGIDDDDHLLPGFRHDRWSTLGLLATCGAPPDVFDVYFERRPNAKLDSMTTVHDHTMVDYLLRRGAVCINAIHERLYYIVLTLGSHDDNYSCASSTRQGIEVLMRYGADPSVVRASGNASVYQMLETHIQTPLNQSWVPARQFVYRELRRMEAMAAMASGRTLARNARSVMGRVPVEVLQRIREMVEFDTPQFVSRFHGW
jgi:hypothetical protein